MTVRLATTEDFLEDLQLTARELQPRGVSVATFKRLVTKALNDDADARERATISTPDAWTASRKLGSPPAGHLGALRGTRSLRPRTVAAQHA
jgi:hypothetical protein